MKKLYYGGNIITMCDNLYEEAVLTEDDKIIDCGPLSKFEKEEAERINLKGKTMIPGFIDAHSHFSQVASSFMQVSLNGVTNSSEIKERITNYIKEENIKPGEWITARDYDDNIMDKNPDFDTINSFSPDNPLVIRYKSGHMGFMNKKALSYIGIDDDTKSPDGGLIGKENGKLTGYLEENAFFLSLKKTPPLDNKKFLASYKKAQEKYASYGITTFQDGMAVEEVLPLYDMLLKENILKLDLYVYPGYYAFKEAYSKYKDLPINSHFKVGGIKIFLDGSPQGRTAFMREPYKDSKDYRGYPTMTDDEIYDALKMAAEYKTQLICHCNGDGAAEQFLRCLERAEKDYPILKTLRPVIIHGQLMGRDQLKKVKELNAMVSFFIAHIYHWGDTHIKNFGMERASNISPAGSALKENIIFTFHQDAPVIEPFMQETIECAVRRITKNGIELNKEERISPYDALCAVTKNAAYQYFMEDKIGVIKKNAKADFAILSDDILKVDYDKIKDIKVLETIKDGKTIFIERDVKNA